MILHAKRSYFFLSHTTNRTRPPFFTVMKAKRPKGEKLTVMPMVYSHDGTATFCVERMTATIRQNLTQNCLDNGQEGARSSGGLVRYTRTGVLLLKLLVSTLIQRGIEKGNMATWHQNSRLRHEAGQTLKKRRRRLLFWHSLYFFQMEHSLQLFEKIFRPFITAKSS